MSDPEEGNTTITIPKTLRTKLGSLITQNETMSQGLERLIDEMLASRKKTQKTKKKIKRKSTSK